MKTECSPSVSRVCGQLLKAIEEFWRATGIGEHCDGGSVCPRAVRQRSSRVRHCLQTFRRTFTVLHLMPAMCRLLVGWFVTRYSQRKSFPEQDGCAHLALQRASQAEPRRFSSSVKAVVSQHCTGFDGAGSRQILEEEQRKCISQSEERVTKSFLFHSLLSL